MQVWVITYSSTCLVADVWSVQCWVFVVPLQKAVVVVCIEQLVCLQRDCDWSGRKGAHAPTLPTLAISRLAHSSTKMTPWDVDAVCSSSTSLGGGRSPPTMVQWLFICCQGMQCAHNACNAAD